MCLLSLLLACVFFLPLGLLIIFTLFSFLVYLVCVPCQSIFVPCVKPSSPFHMFSPCVPLECWGFLLCFPSLYLYNGLWSAAAPYWICLLVLDCLQVLTRLWYPFFSDFYDFWMFVLNGHWKYREHVSQSHQSNNMCTMSKWSHLTEVWLLDEVQYLTQIGAIMWEFWHLCVSLLQLLLTPLIRSQTKITDFPFFTFSEHWHAPVSFTSLSFFASGLSLCTKVCMHSIYYNPTPSLHFQ